MSSKILLSLCLLSSALFGQEAADPLQQLRTWLASSPTERPPIAEQDFARVSLTRSQAEAARSLMIADLESRLREERAAEWQAKEIRIAEHRMRFDFKVFGKAADGQKSLFISMHGGGSAPTAINDQQWRNQIGLYEPKEGVYLAPRAPTDTWNLWHQADIDAFFTRIIENAVLFAGVNFDRVYLLGYSAGGDGVYQLAPRMSDHFAAAAMMAGHPNETRPLGLRNLPFTLHMGADDSAFKRNEVAATWKTELEKLRQADPKGYPHEVMIHAGKGHWMDRKDAVALPWMTQHERRRRPDRVVWLQDDVLHDRSYWLGMPKAAQVAGAQALVKISDQKLIIEAGTTATALTFFLDDDLTALDRPITLVRPNEKDQVFTLSRTISVIAATLNLDSAGVFFSRLDTAIE